MLTLPRRPPRDAALVSAEPPYLPPFSQYAGDSTADNSNLDPTLLKTGLSPWTPPNAPSQGVPNQPPFLPAGPELLPGITAKPPAAKPAATGSCVLDGLADLGAITFLQALNLTGMNATVRGLANVTLLVPTDESFDAWSSSLKAVPAAELKAAMQLHVIPGGRALLQWSCCSGGVMPGAGIAGQRPMEARRGKGEGGGQDGGDGWCGGQSCRRLGHRRWALEA
jgi:hypothetical protein